MDSKLYESIGSAVKRAQVKGGSLTEQNLLYVVKVATQMANETGADFDDLLCAGVLGMMKAEERYNPELNDNFCKSAYQDVRGYMKNFVNRNGTLVHIPANHLRGFKKGQEATEDTKVEYTYIDESNYDTLGSIEMNSDLADRESILQDGLMRLDINGRIAMEMKLRLGKYAEMVPSEKDPTKMVFKYNNNMQSIADELEVPKNMANKIYKSAYDKLKKYCTSMYAE